MDAKVREAIQSALESLYGDAASTAAIEVEIPRDKQHGDLSSNAAMTLAKVLRKAPRDIAADLEQHLKKQADWFSEVSVAGPGFLNFRMTPEFLHGELQGVLRAGSRYGRSDAGQGQRIQVEFVSANPTGPLNVVSARAAAFGGALTRILEAAGYAAESEFYVNDVGGQIDLLGETFLARVRQAQGLDAEIPEEGYQGEYLKELAQGLDPEYIAASTQEKSDTQAAQIMAKIAVERMVAWQKRDLADYGTEFDRWFHQHELYPEAVESTAKRLEEAGYLETREGAVWFRSTEFGDDQDRVLIRSTGEPTYFLADLAYHTNKHDRGFEKAVDIWGPDHHGYIPRMQAGMQALGFGADWLQVLIVQQVNLLQDGKPVKMSKRKGEFITLSDLIEDVGKDTAVFFFLQRRAESHLDFDLDLAKKQSDENPVFYVKYAHARISGILRKAREEKAPDSGENPPLHRLIEDPELNLIKTLVRFPGVLAGAARHREPHRLTGYLRDVAQSFHGFYHHCRVITEDPELTRARLGLTKAAGQVLANGLALMNIDAPERM